MNILNDLKLEYKTGGIVNKLILSNVSVFIVSIVFFYKFKYQVFELPNWLALSSNVSTILFYPWTLLTYSFLHSGFGHLFFNMLVLYFYSKLFLTFFNEKQFLGLYLLGALFAGITFFTVYYFLNINGTIVGASGAIMTILMATTTYQPLMNIRLLLIGNIKLWYLTAVILVINILDIYGGNTGGIIAHLGGAFFGFIYIKLLQTGTDLSLIITKIIDFFVNIFRPKKHTTFKKVYKTNTRTVEKKVSKIVTVSKTQQQIDEILDKISLSGYDSLTQSEKEFLFKAGK